MCAFSPTLRCDLYKGLADDLLSGETDGSRLGVGVTLPSSYTGGARYMIQSCVNLWCMDHVV